MANNAAPTSSVDLTAGHLPTSGPGVSKTGTKSADADDKGIYINEVNPYEFMRHADNGTGGFKHGQYLTNHTRERDFRERRNYSYYLNFTRRIISALVKPIYREEPVRKEESANAFWVSFQKDCNRRRHTFNKFITKVARKVKRYGVYFIVVDNDKAAKIEPTLAGATANKQHPYIYCYSPEDICEYEWDDLQKLSLVCFREWFKNKDGEKVWRYRVWTPTKWVLYEEEMVDGQTRRKQVEEGEITIGEIPIIPIYDEEPDEEEDPILPHPPLYHIARTNLSIFDVCSELRELERNQMFSLLRIPVENGKGIPALEVGTKNAIPFPKDASQPPDFMSPDPAIAMAIMADRKFLIEQMFEMASLVGIVGVVVKEQSGRGKEWDFQGTREELTRFGHIMEHAEKEVARLFGLYIKKELKYEVNYSENYGLVDMTAETENTSAALSLNISPEVNVELKKDWTRKYFRDSEEGFIDDMLESIDTAAEDEEHARVAKTEAQIALDNAAAAAAGAEAEGGEKPDGKDSGFNTGAGNAGG